jgi:hypothetical protein
LRLWPPFVPSSSLLPDHDTFVRHHEVKLPDPGRRHKWYYLARAV